MATSSNRISPKFIKELKPGEIFVFGSNLQGQHFGGAARIAHDKFGAEWGIGYGLTGNCFAIPTMHGGVEAIRPYVDKFIEYAKVHPEYTFLVTRIGCGIAGFKDEEMAPLFAKVENLPNVYVPQSWVEYIFTDTDNSGHDMVITDECFKALCHRYEYEIGAGICDRVPKILVRYVCNENEFGYTYLENCFLFFDDELYVWVDDEKWADDHNEDVVDAVFNSKCEGRGYAIRAIFAGIPTSYYDINCSEIYSGDVIEIDTGTQKIELALGIYNNEYCFMLDDRMLTLAECRKKEYRLKRVGTVFFQLDWSDDPMTIQEFAIKFNNPKDTDQEHSDKVLMAKFTPSFEKDIWAYKGFEILGKHYQWRE